MLTSLPSEVLDAICHALSPSMHRRPSPKLRQYRREGLKTLASLARTSRRLHKPAVDGIWHIVANITVLLQTLPDDLRIETDVAVPDPEDPDYISFEKQLSFKRRTVQSDFDRLKHYAHRIEYVTHANTELITSDVFDALVTHFPAGTLLPNIHTLSYASTPSESYKWLPLLVGPKLRSLCLIGPAPSQVKADHPNAEPLDCLRVLPRICLTLSELTARMDLETKIPHTNIISGVILSFQGLTSVLVPGIPLDFKAIMHLARLRNLETLSAHPSDEITEDDYQYLTSMSTNGQACFPSLRKMSIKNRFLAFCTPLLKVVSSPVLNSVTFTTTRVFGVYCITEDVSELCIELARHPTLTSITVIVNSMLDGSPLSRETFAPLLALSELAVLDLNISHATNIDDAFLADMARSWPKITRLDLCVQFPFWNMDVYYPAATLPGLIPFARFCPALEVLGVPVCADISRIPHPSLERRPMATRGPGAPKNGSGMYHLKVGLSVMREPWTVPVAAFLSDVFPALEGVSTAWTDGMGEDVEEGLDGDIGTPAEIRERWDEVATLARRFGEVRNQERNWTAAHGQGRTAAGAGASG